MRKNEYTGIFLIVIFSGVIFFLAFLVDNKTEHDRRMELIKEKEALIHLQNWVEIKQNQHWIDSMHNEINKDLK
ncbi:MAG: hypothetical protein RIR48_3315, partial [Bacteroidota bacterium]|jgi:hypothetical protein